MQHGLGFARADAAPDQPVTGLALGADVNARRKFEALSEAPAFGGAGASKLRPRLATREIAPPTDDLCLWPLHAGGKRESKQGKDAGSGQRNQRPITNVEASK